MRMRLRLRRTQLTIAAAAVLLGGALAAFPASYSFAQDTGKHRGLTAEEFSAQSRQVIRRAPRRVRIYNNSRVLGPNSVRICNAHYEQEYRPSGTVIVPRMRCYWSG